VWFGEELDSQMLKRVQQHIARDPVDLCIVIGTSGTVYPAAGYVAGSFFRFRRWFPSTC